MLCVLQPADCQRNDLCFILKSLQHLSILTHIIYLRLKLISKNLHIYIFNMLEGKKIGSLPHVKPDLIICKGRKSKDARTDSE